MLNTFYTTSTLRCSSPPHSALINIKCLALPPIWNPNSVSYFYDCLRVSVCYPRGFLISLPCFDVIDIYFSNAWLLRYHAIILCSYSSQISFRSRCHWDLVVTRSTKTFFTFALWSNMLLYSDRCIALLCTFASIYRWAFGRTSREAAT